MPTPSKDQILAALAANHQAQERLKREEVELVAAAREADAEWTEIGQAIGMLRQHASRKFRPLLEERRVVTVRTDPG